MYIYVILVIQELSVIKIKVSVCSLLFMEAFCVENQEFVVSVIFVTRVWMFGMNKTLFS